MSHSHNKTYISSLGFNDLDKKNPNHDSICLDLTDAKFIYEIINIMAEKIYECEQIKYRIKNIVNNVISDHYVKFLKSEHFIKLKYELLKQRIDTLTDDEIIKEHRYNYYTHDNDYRKESIDVLTRKNDLLKTIGEHETSGEKITITEEDKEFLYLNNRLDLPETIVHELKLHNFNCEELIYKGTHEYKQVVGFIDIKYTINLLSKSGNVSWQCDMFDIFIEVKTNKVSIQEIIRQIKFYNGFIRTERPYTFILLADFDIDDREKNLLNNESITYINYGDLRTIIDARNKSNLDVLDKARLKENIIYIEKDHTVKIQTQKGKINEKRNC